MKYAAIGTVHRFLDRLFKLEQNATTVKTELAAGLTTFMTMAYILAVNPQGIRGDRNSRGQTTKKPCKRGLLWGLSPKPHNVKLSLEKLHAQGTENIRKRWENEE